MLGIEHANEALRNHKLKFVKPGTKLPHEDFKTLKAKKEALKALNLQGAKGSSNGTKGTRPKEAMLAQSESKSGKSGRDHCLYPDLIDSVFPLRESIHYGGVHDPVGVWEFQVWIYTQF